MGNTPSDPARAFVEASRAHLLGEYIPKIQRCLNELSPAEHWWRPNPASNAVGNLVLHLCGNATQWILHGVLGDPDIRTRDAEFDSESMPVDDTLQEHLRGAADSLNEGFDRIIEATTVDRTFLEGTRQIQGLDVTVLEAVYHVVEHFAQHTGQIIYVTKMRTAADLGFWDVQGGVARPNW